MKNKYVAIGGFAFTEESDMKKLSNYARKGWILDSIVGGFFYKLRKGTPQNIIYTLDYQDNVDEEYFSIFKEAGWDLVVSIGNKMNIFSAPVGTKPIYSDMDTEMEKYKIMKEQTKRGTVYSLLIGVILVISMIVSVIAVKSIFLILLGLFIIDIIVFIFNFMPYLAYNDRVKQVGKINNGNKKLWKISMFAGALFIIAGVLNLIKKDYLSLIYISLGIFFIISSFKEYKEYKKYL